MKEAQQVVAEKTSTLEAEAYKTKRLNVWHQLKMDCITFDLIFLSIKYIQEELAQLKRRVERLKKIEAAGTADEVLREELREYKDTLTCPSCKVTRKDAVLTKCFHVFCQARVYSDCIQNYKCLSTNLLCCGMVMLVAFCRQDPETAGARQCLQ